MSAFDHADAEEGLTIEVSHDSFRGVLDGRTFFPLLMTVAGTVRRGLDSFDWLTSFLLRLLRGRGGWWRTSEIMIRREPLKEGGSKIEKHELIRRQLFGRKRQRSLHVNQKNFERSIPLPTPRLSAELTVPSWGASSPDLSLA